MPQAIFFSEGLIELHPAESGSPGVSGDGIAMALAAAYLRGPLSQATGQPEVDVEMLTAAGDDPYGHKILQHCRSNGVGTRWFSLMPLLPSSDGLMNCGGTASWEFVPDRDPVKTVANVYHNRDAQDCPIDRLIRDIKYRLIGFTNTFDTSTVFVISGIAASRPFYDDTFTMMIDFIANAKKRGATIIVDPNTRPRLFPTTTQAHDRLTRLFQLADFALPSFPSDLTPQGTIIFPWDSPDAAAIALHDIGVPNVIVKLGIDGSVWFGANGNRTTVPTTPITDGSTAGAGDSFVGGFAIGLAAGLSIEKAMRLGTCAAVQTVKSLDRATLNPRLAPTAEQITSLLT